MIETREQSEVIEGQVTELVGVPTATHFAITIGEARERLNQLRQFISQEMREGTDYGTIPGTAKPCLYKAGADKLVNIFGFELELEQISKTENWDKPFFHYAYRATLRDRYGRAVGICEGSCNSMENKYRWRWVPETELPQGVNKAMLANKGSTLTEYDFAIGHGQTTGKYGKPPEYWKAFRDAMQAGTAKQVTKKTKDGRETMAWQIDATLYRIENDDLYSLVNTLDKMAQKRAIVGATVIATRTSDIFSDLAVDTDDNGHEETGAEPPGEETTTQKTTKPEEPPKSAPATKQGPPRNGQRPYAPEVLKEKIAAGINDKRAKGRTGPLSDAQIGLLASMLELPFAGDKEAAKKRRDLTEYLVGVSSVKTLTQAEGETLLNWIIKSHDEQTNEYIPDPLAVAEARLVIRHLLQEAGQQDMEDLFGKQS